MSANLIITLTNALLERDTDALNNVLQDMMSAGLIELKDATTIMIAVD